ncbi:hypothetical protein, partial [Neisseria dentiae]|uniref:hypothetical protein n=1 Tax=Neisseria dentiae TaxID=194197 RepID=UPI0035A086F8
MKKHFHHSLLCLAAAALLLCGCKPPEKQHPATQAAQGNQIKMYGDDPSDYNAPDVVGNMGGRPIRVPSYVAIFPSWEDTPTAFAPELETYKAPPRNYQSKMKRFSFELNFETGEIKDDRFTDSLALDKQRKQSGHPWVSVGVTNGVDFLDRKDWLDGYLQDDLDGKSIPANIYHKTNQTLYGLEVYAAPKIKDRWTGSYPDDLYIARHPDGHVRTYIKCSTNQVPTPPCKHIFAATDGMMIKFSLSYDRHRLADWQKIEAAAKRAFLSFIVDPATG